MLGIVYILKSEDGRYYIGSTNDLKRRFLQHKQGHTWTTQGFKNPVIAFHQTFDSLKEARKIELRKKIKEKRLC